MILSLYNFQWIQIVFLLSIFYSNSLIGQKHIKKGDLLYKERFSNSLDSFVIEQVEGGTTKIENGKLEVIDKKGCTIWLTKQFEGPVVIEYDVKFISDGGLYDRVSDMNVFWMATDPERPDDFFGNKERDGRFKTYTPLQLYYVGYGANNNKTTRFRRYDGKGNKPLLPEHDLKDERFILKAGKKYHVKLVACDETIQYYCNGVLVFDIHDPHPFTKGYFGFRINEAHQLIDNLRVFRAVCKK